MQVIEMFPSTQKTFVYNFGANVSGYTFESDYQTIVVDTLSYDRTTGEPNFTDSTVMGYFANSEIDANNIVTTGAASGEISLTIPSQRYTGPLTPDARTNVAITVASFKWTDTNVTPNTTDSHRWAIIERWEPDVAPGNPRLSASFTPLGVGAIGTFTDNSSASALRGNVAGTYNGVSGIATSTGGVNPAEGIDATWQIVVAADGTCTINIQTRGGGYSTGDTIEILDSDLGGSGAPNITITVTAVL